MTVGVAQVLRFATERLLGSLTIPSGALGKDPYLAFVLPQ